jgi:hypothetical protein
MEVIERGNANGKDMLAAQRAHPPPRSAPSAPPSTSLVRGDEVVDAVVVEREVRLRGRRDFADPAGNELAVWSDHL